MSTSVPAARAPASWWAPRRRCTSSTPPTSWPSSTSTRSCSPPGTAPPRKRSACWCGRARLVGGRPGGGRILLQTRQPRHEVVQAAVMADPTRVAIAEADRRRELAYPPATAMAVVSGPSAPAWVEAFGQPTGVEVLGPGRRPVAAAGARPRHAVRRHGDGGPAPWPGARRGRPPPPLTAATPEAGSHRVGIRHVVSHLGGGPGQVGGSGVAGGPGGATGLVAGDGGGGAHVERADAAELRDVGRARRRSRAAPSTGPGPRGRWRGTPGWRGRPRGAAGRSRPARCRRCGSPQPGPRPRPRPRSRDRSRCRSAGSRAPSSGPWRRRARARRPATGGRRRRRRRCAGWRPR